MDTIGLIIGLGTAIIYTTCAIICFAMRHRGPGYRILWIMATLFTTSQWLQVVANALWLRRP